MTSELLRSAPAGTSPARPDAPTPGSDGPWPLTARRDERGIVVVGGVAVDTLARRFGTPLLVVDEADVRHRCRRLRAAFGDVRVAYGAKAWCTTGILQLVSAEGLAVDVVSGGELHTARVAGVPMGDVVFHGSNKSEAELEMAADLGVGRVVVDSFDELERLERIGAARDHRFTCWLRVTPGVDAHTHEYTRTGHDDTKFGFTLSLGLADQALERALALAHVEVVGVHAHIGSQIWGLQALAANAEIMVDLLARWRRERGVDLDELNVGGGLRIAYRHDDRSPAVEQYAATLEAAVAAACDRHDLSRPRLWVEPGRAVVGPSTITVYRVGTVKVLPGLRTYVSVDGGMSDNIRPALYGAAHEMTLAGRRSTADDLPVTVVGKHCESGDLLAEGAHLPGDVAVGDLLAVAATGAYTEAMASNYNRLPRPAAVLVRDGEARDLIRRETYPDLTRRDVALH